MLEIGSLLDGKYKILNKVGQGGMSVVYLAMNEKANKQWAVKEVRKDGVKDFEIVRQGLIAETDILKKLRHPNLPTIIDVITTDDSFIIIMDYIEGNSLNKALEEYGAQPQDQVIRWAKQLCDVLGYLHTREPAIIYRDMKPANIMLKPNGDITLIDFGTAREFKEKKLEDTTCLGTVGYAAPEQFGGMGQTDARTDIYCLGATLYHLVTGKNPCEPPYEILPIREINPALSSGLERIILKCTQRDPDDRYQSAAELMYALEHYTEIDDQYRKKQKSKLGLFITTSVLTLAFGAVSLWGFLSAENQKGENYDYILNEANSVEAYYNAIITDPGREEAYCELNEYLIEDYSLSQKEGQHLMKLLLGVEKKERNGFTQVIDALEELKTSNLAGYEKVCFEMGWSFLSYYSTPVDRERYTNAEKWFSLIQHLDTKNGEIASIFCDISRCTTKINQLHGSKMLQTQELKAQREELWAMVLALKEKAELYELDYRVQVWIEIDNLINDNMVDFLEVALPEQIFDLLKSIQTGISNLPKDNVDIQIFLTDLQASLKETLQRLEAAQN